MRVVGHPAPGARLAQRAYLLPGAGLFLLFLLSGCGSDPAANARRWIVTANDLQDTAAKAYDQAKVDELAAGKLCRQAATAAGKPLPAPDSPEAAPFCASLGAPLPYDPARLPGLAGPINAAYEAVRAADALRLAGGDPVKAAVQAVDVVAHLYDLAADLGLSLPFAKATALRQEARP